MRNWIKWSSLFGLLLLVTPLFSQPKLKIENIGDFKLESDKVIEDCKIAYRTFGKLNKDKSNVILFPTEFAGKSEHLASLIGRDFLVDDKKYYVIAVDALFVHPHFHSHYLLQAVKLNDMLFCPLLVQIFYEPNT